MSDKHKHLDFIQIIITRMAVNSFLLKGWTITLIAGIFALSAKDANHKYIWLALFPIFIFWVLDGYYLLEERLFRSLYNHVRKLEGKEIDFSMNTKPYRNEIGNNLCATFCANTISFFYLSLIIVLIIIYFFI
ncbi:MAG: hypothetical protein KGI58_02155 [Patescibacteria group bacterium]|nr:hypothetical protein [Patescibacteria group bacterium]